MTWESYKARVKRHPKEVLEADLVIAIVGAVIAVVGGCISVAGIQPWSSNTVTPAPGLANFAFFGGMVIVAAGVLMAIINVTVYIAVRRRQSGGPHSSSSDYTPIEPG